MVKGSVPVLVGIRFLLFCHPDWFWANPASSSMGTGELFPQDKVAMA
jgi:hypothetical protein